MDRTDLYAVLAVFIGVMIFMRSMAALGVASFVAGMLVGHSRRPPEP
jgi:hypothetical protein